jgi:ABC-type transport system involved in multi-copper enzyme maturation permease subunit
MKEKALRRQKMLNLIRVEFFKLRKRWMPYVLLLVLLASILIPIVVSYINYQSDVDGFQIVEWKEMIVLPDAMQNVFNSIPGLGIILVAILAASTIGNEYAWGTLRQTLARGTSRPGYLTSKLLSTGIAAFIGVLIAIVIGLIATIITSMVIEGEIIWGSFVGYFFASLGRTLLVLVVYISMATLFSVLLRSSGLGIMVTIAWFIGESIIGGLLSMSSGWLADIPQYLIMFNTNELMALNSLNPQGDITSWWQSAGILLAYSTIFITASYYGFQRQDLTA